MALIEIAAELRMTAAPAQAKRRPRLEWLAFALTFVSAASIVFSLAASRILMATAPAAAGIDAIRCVGRDASTDHRKLFRLTLHRLKAGLKAVPPDICA